MMDEPKDLDWSNPEVRRLNCTAAGREVLFENNLVEGIGLWLLELQVDHENGTYMDRLRYMPDAMQSVHCEVKHNEMASDDYSTVSFSRALGYRREVMVATLKEAKATNRLLNEDLLTNYESVKSRLHSVTTVVSSQAAVWSSNHDFSDIGCDSLGGYFGNVVSIELEEAYNDSTQSGRTHPNPHVRSLAFALQSIIDNLEGEY